MIDIPKIGISKPLREFLLDPTIVKVFQDMKFDLSLFEYEFKIKPFPVFDISLADRLIRKSSENQNITKLAAFYLDIELEIQKSMQKSNWGIRPLSEKQIEYASKDVRLIVPIYKKIIETLTGDFRYIFLDKYCQNLKITNIERKFNELSMWKIKGVEKLNHQELWVLKELLILRNEIGVKINRPIHWIYSDGIAMKLIDFNPENMEELIYFLNQNRIKNSFVTKYRKKILRIFEIDYQEMPALMEPAHGVSLKTWVPIDTPNGPKRIRPERIRLIKEWVKTVSFNLGLLPEFVLDKSEILMINELKNNAIIDEIRFQGIPDKFTETFMVDLMNYLNSGKSELVSDLFN